MKNKGITLVSLVITIIVMLILAGVSISAIVGDNGIITQIQEAKILTALSDVMFNLESSIVDIKLTDLNKKLIATEILEELDKRNQIALDSRYILKDSIANLQGKIIDSVLQDATINYNGDIWVNNYKRGKIQLSQIFNEVAVQNSKISVNDGTIEEVGNKDSIAYKITALENRDDFACWVNKYGEVITTLPNTYLIRRSVDEELTALYSSELKENIYNSYIGNFASEALIDNDNVNFEIIGNYNDGKEYSLDGGILYAKTSILSVDSVDMQYSNNLDDLINNRTSNIIGTRKITFKDLVSATRLLGVYDNGKIQVAEAQSTGFKCDFLKITENNNKNVTFYFSIQSSIEDIKNAIKEVSGVKDTNRFYYRTVVEYHYIYRDEYGRVVAVGNPQYELETTIKYVDV